MDELISRQAAIDAMDECYWSIMGDEPPKLDEKTALYVDLKQAVKRLPTAEPRKGKWIYDPELYPMGGAYGHYECDQCGEWIRGSMTNYCPNCGARMEE